MDCKVVLKEKNAHDRANLLSKIFLGWSFQYLYNGYKKTIKIEDLGHVKNNQLSAYLGDKLEEAWGLEIKQSQETNKKPSLNRAIVRSFWVEYLIHGLILGLLNVIIWPLVPYTLSLFISYFSGDKTPESYMIAHIMNFLMNLLSIVAALLFNHLLLGFNVIGMKVRIACCSLVYRKILKLDPAGMAKTETGQIINLMSNDVNRFDMASLYLHYIWVTPLCVIMISYLVWQHIGWATLSALVVSILQSVFLQVYLSNLQGILRGKIAKRTDERVKVMSELVKGVQVIKMYAWEKSFEKLVDKLRRLEINYILRTSFIKGFSMAIMVFSERFILFSAIATFALTGGDIRPEITFSLVQYFNLLQLTANACLPLCFSSFAEANVSVRRLEGFLLLGEFSSKNLNNPTSKTNDESTDTVKDRGNLKPGVLTLSEVNANWNSDLKVETLRNINLVAVPGDFIGVAGFVGSGKSSLLQAILGELRLSNGTISKGEARISYASQEPWLFVGTVRQNILFGLPYDPVRYKKVVYSCALRRDFEQWPAGDAMLVGERGISLSGGQRARISLARACYRQADIYLLDDPLSAVDTHVGKHLVSECVMGLLRHSTRILVTHQLHHLKEADKVVIMHNGEIETQGDFEQISASPLFAELLHEMEESENSSVKSLNHTISIQSQTSSTGPEPNLIDDDANEEQLDEMTGSGRVPLSAYTKYFRAGSGVTLIFMSLVGFIIAQVVTSFSDLWLTYWMNTITKMLAITDSKTLYYGNMNESLNKPENTMNLNDIPDSTAANDDFVGQNSSEIFQFPLDHTYFVYIWAIAILGCIVLTTIRSIVFLWICMRSSINLHNKMFSNILAATMRFFDTNPSGLILNRFSKDMGIVDEFLPRMYLESLQVTMVMLGILVMVAIINPYMIITTAVCGIFMYLYTLLYLTTAQAIKRVEGVSRSPVFSHVSATMAGLGTVRACGAQDMLRTQFDQKQDVHSAAWYINLVTNAAFSVWLTLICSIFVLVVSYTLLLLDDGTTQSGNVGLAISQGLILVNMVQFGVKQTTEVITQMTSVERLLQFTSLPQENIEGRSPPSNWPRSARIVFKDLTLRYDKDSDPVLKKLNVEIESGWKVGVIGRTGAGKSSLISALFRLAPLEGHVLIDNIDSGSIALKELRSKISIIPQEPVLFSASLRYNLDPFDKYSDAEIWTALEQVELKKSVTSLSEMVASGGSNFSAGQRQLLCLARAALGRNKLLVLDEATANVDPNTDALIQKSIRKHFTECTVLTVAHRLHTVADSNRVIVMDAGEIEEFGHPHELLQQEDGLFTSMVKQLGTAAEQSLRELAAEAYLQHCGEEKL